MRHLRLIAVALLAAAGCSRTPPVPADWVSLRGERQADAVAIVWELRGWPADLTGFVVRWRDLDGATAPAWTPLTARAIEPGIALTKPLDTVEPDAVRRRELEADLAQRIASGRAREVRAPEFIAAVRSRPELLEALTIEIRQDPRRALLIGLGAIDRSARDAVAREYGLFAVRGTDRVDAAPAATFTAHVLAPGDARLAAADLAIEPLGAGTHVTWRFADARADAHAVAAFNVYRAPAEGGAFELLTPDGVASPRLDGEWRHFAFPDASADPSVAWRYAVVPRTVFGNELPGRTEAAFVPDRPGAFRPGNVTASSTGRGVSIAWTMSGAAASAVSAFVVLRLELPDGVAAAVSPMLPPAARAHVDTTPTRAGAAYLYVVEADARGRRHASAPATFVDASEAEPPAPSGLRAEALRVSSRTVVRLRWNAAEADDIDGYALFADKATPGRLSRQASVPLVRGLEYDLEVAPLHTRSYTIGIAAVRRGAVGPMAQVTVRVPGAMERQ